MPGLWVLPLETEGHTVETLGIVESVETWKIIFSVPLILFQPLQDSATNLYMVKKNACDGQVVLQT